MLATVVLAVAAVACDRTEANREAEQAADQVKVAAAEAGDKLADSWLTTKIQAQFFADDDIKSRYINVSSRDGTVTLKGFVASDDARRQVLEITRNTDGVKHIDDQQLLVGRAPKESFDTALTGAGDPGAVATTGATPGVVFTPVGDDTVTSMVQARFFQDPAIKSRRIDVMAAQGVVTLKGQVASDAERSQALLLAKTTPGVQRVEDSLTVDAAIN